MAEKEELMVMNSEGQLVPRTLGIDEGAKDYKTYDEAVDDLNAQSNDVEHKLLEVNWAIGRQAYIIKEKSGYGNHDIDSFAADLGRSPSTIYQAIKLYTTFTLQDIQRMRDEDIPLRRANQLAKVPEEQRPMLEDALTQFRMSDDTFRTVVNNASDGVLMPEDPAGRRAYIDKCKDGWRPGADGDAEDDIDDEVDEEEEDNKPSADPADKVVANIRTDCDNFSLDISKLDEDIAKMTNIVQGDLYTALDDEHKESLRGVLTSLRDQLNKTLNKGFKLMHKLPGKATKEADGSEQKQ